MTITMFCFVPGKEWQMTTSDVDTTADIKEAVENFAGFCGPEWTEIRVYETAPDWSAYRHHSVNLQPREKRNVAKKPRRKAR
jgi:hypothetical protein